MTRAICILSNLNTRHSPQKRKITSGNYMKLQIQLGI